MLCIHIVTTYLAGFVQGISPKCLRFRLLRNRNRGGLLNACPSLSSSDYTDWGQRRVITQAISLTKFSQQAFQVVNPRFNARSEGGNF